MGRGISPETNGGANLGSASQQWGTVYTQNVVDSANLGNNYSLGYRQPSTEYSIGDIKYTNALATGKKIVCVKEGTTSSGALTLASTEEGSITTDGTVVWAVDSLADGNYSAGHHNGIYRKANITAYFDSGLMSANIANGNFVNVYIGDLILKHLTIDAVEYEKNNESITAFPGCNENRFFDVADINYFKSSGNHVVMITNIQIAPIRMNDTDDTTGGYVSSEFFTHVRPAIDAGISSAFGENHIVTREEAYSNAMNDSVPSSTVTWRNGSPAGAINVSNIISDIPSLSQAFGYFGKSGGAYNDLRARGQFALMSLKRSITNFENSDVIFRDIASSGRYARINRSDLASVTGGVFPFFIIK